MHQIDTEIQDSGYRIGFAKRKLTPQTIQGILPSKLMAYEVQQAIALGLSDLSSQERDLLQFYTAFLNLANLGEGKTSVWPSSRLACTLLGFSAPTLRRYKASLEHKGYIRRRYDRKNRPMKQGAIDLAPLLSQVKGLLDDIRGKFDAQQAYYSSLDEESSIANNKSAYPLNCEHHKHINSINSFSVPKILGTKERGIRGCNHPGNRPEVALDMQAVRTLIESSITLGPYFTETDWEPLTATEVWDLLDRCVRTLYPEGEGVTQAWGRAKNSVGIQAIELLIVSLDDPQIKDGARFLSFMAYKWEGDLNLKPNLKRVSEHRRQREQDRETQDVAAQLRQKHSIFRSASLSDRTLLSWFGKSEIEEQDELIIVWVENEFVKNRILVDYLSVLQLGCRKNIKIKIR